jgi:hypothetical protein
MVLFLTITTDYSDKNESRKSLSDIARYVAESECGAACSQPRIEGKITVSVTELTKLVAEVTTQILKS